LRRRSAGADLQPGRDRDPPAAARGRRPLRARGGAQAHAPRRLSGLARRGRRRPFPRPRTRNTAHNRRPTEGAGASARSRMRRSANTPRPHPKGPLCARRRRPWRRAVPSPRFRTWVVGIGGTGRRAVPGRAVLRYAVLCSARAALCRVVLRRAGPAGPGSAASPGPGERPSQVDGDVPGPPQLVGARRRGLVLLLRDRLLGQLLLALLDGRHLRLLAAGLGLLLDHLVVLRLQLLVARLLDVRLLLDVGGEHVLRGGILPHLLLAHP